MSVIAAYAPESEGLTYGKRGPNDVAEERWSTQLSTNVADLSPQELGHLGERLAAQYLQNLGWDIVERNWTSYCGEADLIAYDGDVCVLVEVKTRLVGGRRNNPAPELAVTPAKQKRYRRIAQCYASFAGPSFFRFDVVAVSIVADGAARVRHIEAAFGCDE